MSLSLHEVVIGTYLQLLPSLAKLIDKAEAHCKESGSPADALTGACLAEDMWNFAKQVDQSLHHSVHAIQNATTGKFGPDFAEVPLDFESLRKMVSDGIVYLESVDAAALNAKQDADMVFEVGNYRRDYAYGDFLLSFSLLNFYFHVTTAYDILRNRGVKLSKMDFLGRTRSKG